MTLIDQIREMIAEGETERSLKELYNYVKENNDDVTDKLIMLRSRMQNLQNALQNGTMDDQGAAIERAKINEAILKLLPQLTPEYLAQESQFKAQVQQRTTAEKSSHAPTPNRKMLYIAGGAVLLVVLLIVVISNLGSSDDEFSDDFTQQESAIDESVMAPEGSLLHNVIANHGGYAVWESDINTSGQQSFFQFESEEVCNEIINGQIANTFDVVANDPNYITLYDPTRNLYLRLGETIVQFRTEGEDGWNNLNTGEWITPSN